MKKLLLYSFILILILIFGCLHQNDKINNKTNNLKIKNINFNCIKHLGDSVIINSVAEYKKFFTNLKKQSQQCKNYKLPSIDFSKYTLVGKSVTVGGCSADIERNIYKDETNKTIVYSIKAEGKGPCNTAFVSTQWALIQIPSNYHVEFEVK